MSIDLNFKLPYDFAPDSRVWIYQSNRVFSPHEKNEINQMLKNFVSEWTSHGARVKGYATILFDHFVIFIADESATGVSGCSTDSSVRIVKEIEKRFAMDLFNRQMLATYKDGQIELIPISDLNDSIEKGKLSIDDIYFNNTVLSKKELEENWIINLKNSWLSKKINLKVEN
ncbi:MAG: hypothetical protein FGM46_06020 [Ferruginibacter sp.]|nr:hypothetical protein [Ferruginibacter sp.]